MNPYQVVKDFERAVCEYTGAPYCVTVNSCTMALLLAVAWHLRHDGNVPGVFSSAFHVDQPKGRWRPLIEIPKRTYVSVPMSIIHAGGRPTFRDEEWRGSYQLKPLPIWDSARRFTSKMYHFPDIPHKMICVSFQAVKTLGDTQGGALLHDSQEADMWLRKARFDGRTEGIPPVMDKFDMVGYHCYMSNDVAARLLLKLRGLPLHNEPLPNDEYPDLSQMEIFRGG